MLLIFSLEVSGVFSAIIDTMILAGLIPGFAITQTASGRELTVASGPCTALGSLAVIGIFRLWFRPSFDGMPEIEQTHH